MTLLEKQCIVESHSEYLVNRLRYLAAVGPGAEVSSNTILYFVEKKKGRSSYRPIHINEFGVIPDWPKGFFDENEETSAALLKAAMAKRKSRKKDADKSSY
jgi:predicted ATPase